MGLLSGFQLGKVYLDQTIKCSLLKMRDNVRKLETWRSREGQVPDGRNTAGKL